MAEIKMPTVPWTVPNRVQIFMPSSTSGQAGYPNEGGTILSSVDSQVLSEMCDEFRASIFLKAGKPDPRLVGTINQSTGPVDPCAFAGVNSGFAGEKSDGFAGLTANGRLSGGGRP